MFKKKPAAPQHMATHVNNVPYCSQQHYIRFVTVQGEYRRSYITQLIKSCYLEMNLMILSCMKHLCLTCLSQISLISSLLFLFVSYLGHLKLIFCSGGLFTSWCAEQKQHGMYAIWTNGKHSHGCDPTSGSRQKQFTKKKKKKRNESHVLRVHSNK